VTGVHELLQDRRILRRQQGVELDPVDPFRSQTAAITAARVPLSCEGNDMEVKRFPLPITGSHLLIGLPLLCNPFEIPIPSDRRLRPESVREGPQRPLHHPTVLRPHR